MLARDEDARRILDLIVEPQTKGLRMGGRKDERKRGGRERARLASGVKTPEEEGPGTPGLKPRPPEKPLRGETGCNRRLSMTPVLCFQRVTREINPVTVD